METKITKETRREQGFLTGEEEVAQKQRTTSKKKPAQAENHPQKGQQNPQDRQQNPQEAVEVEVGNHGGQTWIEREKINWEGKQSKEK